MAAGCRGPREALDPQWQLRRIVVLQEAVAGVGIHLDVVVDARRRERAFWAFGNFANAGPAILAAVAGDNRAGVGEEAFALLGEPASSRSPHRTRARGRA